jgi:single-strand DNA-binding protein
MSNETEIMVKGWVGQHPRLSVTRSGGAMVTLRVGSTPRRRDAVTGEWGDAPTSWFSVLAFGDLADNVARSLRKGDPVLVRGRYSLKRSEYQGKEHVNAEIVADAIGPELGHGTALYAPMVRRARDAGDGARAADWAAGTGDGDADAGAAGGPGEIADLSFAVELDGDTDEAGLHDEGAVDAYAGAGDLTGAGSDELVGTP